ncbi:winged helix DNA-binding domain-containing protein, partial [Peniophora sp. CONT]
MLRPISPDDSYAGHSPSSTPGPSGDPDGEAAAAHLRALLQLEPGAPINLYSLEDPLPGHKPNFPLPTLIKLAIFGSPLKRLTLQEIYTELENRFEWFRLNTHDTAWKNSIRHNLSLRKCFVKTTRTMTEPGKGSYWSLD